VAAVGNAPIYISANFGTNWTPRGSSSAWLGSASSANGSNLVAAAFNVLGAGGQLATSTNAGLTWNVFGTNLNWWTVGACADGTKLIAGIYGGQLYLSTNSGANWAPSGPTNRWTSVACSADGTKFVAASDFSTGIGKIFVYPPLVPAPPSLAVSLTSSNTAVVSWPSAFTNWNLQQSTNLADTNWDIPPENANDDGTNKFIVVDPPVGERFFRLITPQ